MAMKYAPVVRNSSNIPIFSFDSENGEDSKKLNKYTIQKKFTTYHNTFFYLKTIVEILSSKLYDWKNSSKINADYYDIMFMLHKKMEEALVDAWNTFTELKSNAEKADGETPKGNF